MAHYETEMIKYCVEYLSMTGRLKAVHVTAESIFDAVETAAEVTGCNFSDVKSVKEL